MFAYIFGSKLVAFIHQNIRTWKEI